MSKDFMTRGQATLKLIYELDDPHSYICTHTGMEMLKREYASYSDSPRSEAIDTTAETLQDLDNGDTKAYHSSGDTYFIRLDSFMIDLNESIDYEENTHIILENGIKNALDGGYKNIVIDVSENTGGYVVESQRCLQYIIDGEINTLYRNYLNNSAYIETYKFDLNKDGLYNSEDTYKGLANFYVQTSQASFSAANDYPCISKDSGIKIIGQQSGGGACTVSYLILPSFQIMSLSGIYTTYTSKSEDTRNIDKWNTMEYGAEVDIEFAISKSRDYAYIDSLLK